MTNFSRTRSDAAWADGTTLLPDELAHLDEKVFKGINWDEGGTWAPSPAPIVFGGKIIQVTGPTLVAYGGELRTIPDPSGGGLHGRFEIADGDTPTISAKHPFAKRDILQPMLHRQLGATEDWIVDLATASPRSVALSVQTTDQSTIASPAPHRVPLRVHDGATLTKATFKFRVAGVRTRVPVALPKFRVIRVDAAGNIEPLLSVAGGADADGFASPAAPKTAVGWMNSGAAQPFAYVCDQHNVIDASAYEYWAEVLEEVGTTTPVGSTEYDGIVVRERKIDVRCATVKPSTVALTGPTGGAGGNSGVDGIDGIMALSDGDRVLIKDGGAENGFPPTLLPGYEALNGIWIVSTTGNWKRASDFDLASKISPGCIIHVLQGATLAGLNWEACAPYPTTLYESPILANGDSGSPVNFRRMTPAGNTYHSVKLSYEGITDLRFQ